MSTKSKDLLAIRAAWVREAKKRSDAALHAEHAADRAIDVATRAQQEARAARRSAENDRTMAERALARAAVGERQEVYNPATGGYCDGTEWVPSWVRR